MYDNFFLWVPEEHRAASTEPLDMPLTYVVNVTDDVLVHYRATVVPPHPVPNKGFYLVVVDDGVVQRWSFEDDSAAAMDAYSARVDLIGEDPFDERDYEAQP